MDAVKNFAYSLVATAPSPASSGTSLVVTSGGGALFPAAPFNAIVAPATGLPLASNSEVVRVTAKSTDTFTITRAQESSSARSVVVGDQIYVAVTAKTIGDLVTRSPLTAAESTIQSAADVVTLTVKEFAGQTARPLEIQDSSGSVLVYIDASGNHVSTQRVTAASIVANSWIHTPAQIYLDASFLTYLYQDSGALKYHGASGTVTTIAPT